jgi:hypothetical protein
MPHAPFDPSPERVGKRGGATKAILTSILTRHNRQFPAVCPVQQLYQLYQTLPANVRAREVLGYPYPVNQAGQQNEEDEDPEQNQGNQHQGNQHQAAQLLNAQAQIVALQAQLNMANAAQTPSTPDFIQAIPQVLTDLHLAQPGSQSDIGRSNWYNYELDKKEKIRVERFYQGESGQNGTRASIPMIISVLENTAFPLDEILKADPMASGITESSFHNWELATKTWLRLVKIIYPEHGSYLSKYVNDISTLHYASNHWPTLHAFDLKFRSVLHSNLPIGSQSLTLYQPVFDALRTSFFIQLTQALTGSKRKGEDNPNPRDRKRPGSDRPDTQVAKKTFMEKQVCFNWNKGVQCGEKSLDSQGICCRKHICKKCGEKDHKDPDCPNKTAP